MKLWPPRERGWLPAALMSHWFRLCGAQTPPHHLLQSYLICLRGSDASHLSKAAFLLPTLEVALVGRKENESVWGCGVRWYSCSSEVCLVGPELYWLERKLTAEFWGPENLDERKLLKLMPTSALERRAAVQPPLPACTTQTATHTESTPSYPSTQTQDIMHTCISSCTHADNTFWLPL